VNEEEFYASMSLRPFGTQDAVRHDARLRRSVSLGSVLWGTTPLDLQHQLLGPYPEIPAGFDLADFQQLLFISARIKSIDLSNPRNTWLHSLGLFLRLSSWVRNG
jgi:hypothetical protein